MLLIITPPAMGSAVAGTQDMFISMFSQEQKAARDRALIVAVCTRLQSEHEMHLQLQFVCIAFSCYPCHYSPLGGWTDCVKDD